MKKKLYAVFVNLFTVLTLCFFSSMEVYVANYNDFTLPFSQTWWIVLLFSILVAVLLTVFEFFLPDQWLLWINTLIFGLGICAYIQEIFLNSHLILLDGREVVFSPQIKLWNCVIWLLILACIFLAAFLMRKKKKRKYISGLVFLSAAMVFVQAAGLISSVASMPEADYENAGYLSSDGEYTLSSGNNVIVFIVDACSGDYMEQALIDEPDMLRDFDGFTNYPNCISTYSRTYPSLVYLLSGERCYYDVPFNEYLISAFGNSTFLSDIKSCGADIRVFTDPIYFDGAAREQISNFRSFNGKSLDIIRPWVLIKQMLHVSGYKCMPYLLKARFQYKVIILNHLVRKDPSDIAIEFQDYDFYTNFQKKGVTVSEDYPSSFRLYHLWGPHGACFIDENVNLLDGVEPTRALRGDFKIISDYIHEMKNQNIYDSSTIIILADHGNSYGNDKLEIGEEKTCLMMVKPAYQNGAVQTSEAPVSHENFFSTVLSAYGVTDENFSAPEVYNVSENCSEPRYYYYDARFSDGNGVIASREYRIDGDARDFSSYSLTGKYWDINFSQEHLSTTRLAEFLADIGDAYNDN